VNVLTTLMKADGGTVRVAGHDVATEAKAVRAAIGVTGQFAAVDELLTGSSRTRRGSSSFRIWPAVMRRSNRTASTASGSTVNR
jgi:ABC-2 type transport system ATP-binding protein